jgi:hypothetical protein
VITFDRDGVKNRSKFESLTSLVAGDAIQAANEAENDDVRQAADVIMSHAASFFDGR